MSRNALGSSRRYSCAVFARHAATGSPVRCHRDLRR
jgi:hypothetical protein